VTIKIKSISKRFSKAVAQSLIDADMSFSYEYVGSDISAYVIVFDPSPEQLRFLNRHYKAKIVKTPE